MPDELNTEDLLTQLENLATLTEAMRDTIANLTNENLLLRQANIRARAQLNGHSDIPEEESWKP